MNPIGQNIPVIYLHFEDTTNKLYPVDPYSCYMCDHTYIQIVLHFSLLLFLSFSVLVANPSELLYTMANPARGLQNPEHGDTTVVL